jgi:hypothetical protein
MKKNAIRIILPYYHSGTWVFDDPAVGLEREPFVCGVPEIIDLFVGALENPKSGFRMLFSEQQFPGSTVCLHRCESELGGWWYQLHESPLRGWLCPAMFHYFEEAPESIFAKVESAS